MAVSTLNDGSGIRADSEVSRVAVRVGINGMGRIGRSFWRVARGRTAIEVVAINDLGDAATLAHLLRYDSVRGRLDAEVSAGPGHILVDGRPIPVMQEPKPGAVPWGDYGVAVVLESTGRFFRAADVRGHLDGGAERVVISMATPDPDATIIMGINESEYNAAQHAIVSPGCCTSNAVAPMLAVLREHFGVVTGHLTTVHAYDSTHSSLHDTDYRNRRMGRAAAVNLVPSRTKDTTRALAQVFPDLAGCIEGLAIRVPAAIGCVADLVVRVGRETNAAEVNAALAAASSGQFKGYLGYTEEPFVSSDIIGSAESCIVDGGLTTVVADSVKLFGWYDNEWGFANRLVDVVHLVGGA
jgi:glyceraldehyde 3-phosphate dehydrogenase